MEAIEIDQPDETELAAELRIVEEAILLVATGGARRVVVANLHHGNALIEPARDVATRVDVALEVLETSDPRRVDLAASPSAVQESSPAT